MMEALNTVKLGSVVETIMGQAPAGKDCNKEGKGTPFVKVGEFGRERPIIREWTTDPKKLAKKTDVLLCVVGATCGKINLGEDCAIGRSVAAIRPIEGKIVQHYLHYFMQGQVEELRRTSQGAAQTVISKTMIADVDIPLPPLREQKRIVAILDEAFEGIERAAANAQKNLANARELFDSTLHAIFRRGVEWERVTLAELIERRWITSHLDGNHGSDYPRKSEFIDHGVPYISANCLKNEAVDFSLAKYLSPERAASMRKGIAQNQDVLFAHNATVGPVALLYTDLDKVILSTSLTYYRCNKAYIAPEYLAHYMRSPDFKKQYELVMRQSTRNQVPITKQREFFHIIPPVEEQGRIAEHLDGLSDEVSRLGLIYQQKLSALVELKQSILQKAFSGELTAQPDQALKDAVA